MNRPEAGCWKYPLSATANSFAFSKSYISDKKVFLKAGAGTVCFISALAEYHYQLNPEGTANPFFQGNVTFNTDSDESKVYCTEEKDISMRHHPIQVFDREGRLVLAYSIGDDAPKSLRKTPFIKTVISQGMSRRSGGSVSDVKDPYIEISEIFRQLFQKK